MQSKLLLIFSAALIFFSACKHKNAERPDLHKKHSPSPQIKQLSTYIKDDKTGAEYLSQQEYYDQQGHKLKVQHYNEKAKLIDETNYTYNSNGDQTEARSKDMHDSSELIQTYVYDKDKKISKMDWKKSDHTFGSYVYKYDSKGEVKEMEVYQDGAFMYTQVNQNQYSKSGKILEGKTLTTRNTKDTLLDNRIVYGYDSLERLIAIERFDLHDFPESAEQYVLDSMDNKVMEIQSVAMLDSSQGGGKLSPVLRVLNVFNEYGDLTQSTVYKAEQGLYYTLNKKYDEYGHLINAQFKYADDKTRQERYVYEYYAK